MLHLKSTVLWTAFAIWAAVVLGGMAYALVYEHTPSPVAAAGNSWPGESSCKLAADRITLVMFVHPRCPCSRASLEELAILMTRGRGQIAAQLLFFKPPSVAADWADTDLWSSAGRIPGVTPRVDADGREQELFAAQVSGEVFAYRPSGELVFHGGITAGRGHAGDNAGRLSLEQILLDWQPATATPVFGCKLGTPASN